MKIFSDYSEVAALAARSRIVTIGNFDGVHMGHRAVLAAARRDADRLGLELAVLTFDPHPAELLNPERRRFRLVEPARKSSLLAGCGVDLALIQRFDEAFAALTAEQFASDVLRDALSARLVFVGENFRFGRGREGGVETLRELGETLGFEVRGEQLVQLGRLEVSSSRIRQMIADGDVAGAKELLGRCHETPGTVRRDRGMGAGLGFPTVNLSDIDVLVPGSGIYAATCDTGEEQVTSAVNIGDRPTLGHGYAVEAHLLDFSGDLYGRRVVLRFIERLRDEMKFESTAALVQQITSDVSQVRSIVGASRV